MPTPEQFKEYTDRLEEEAEEQSTDIVYYDWSDRKSLCIAPEPNNQIYGKTVEEYQKCRRDTIDAKDDENTKPSKLTFRIDPFIAVALSNLSRNYNISTYPYVIMLLELGMIHLQRDYHESLSIISIHTNNLLKQTITDKQEAIFLQLSKQTISLGTGIRTNKCFGPSVPRWLGNMVSDYSISLNMSKCDLANICIYLGLERDTEAMKMQRIQKKINDMKDKFCIDLEQLKYRSLDLKQFI
jgi:hypothetical protein